MSDTPPRIRLPDHDPPLNAETARLLLRMLTAVAAHRTGHDTAPDPAAPPPEPAPRPPDGGLESSG
ncbi:hypothetical protein LO772_08425 [Yinghuangia sp. ASG 101]|uniref:hypothetical protein n=1 Tax=Yinghuangia sp. ASG 101 TaxID=2896848 RepID=UPI001E5155E9|nr:hypothetical protein [Yinghuangia sp. ASG 101]UGQ13613.1 hypothetical protein LO772_08425 [Yinghuangia sp. ASG 101]